MGRGTRTIQGIELHTSTNQFFCLRMNTCAHQLQLERDTEMGSSGTVVKDRYAKWHQEIGRLPRALGKAWAGAKSDVSSPHYINE